MLFTEWQKVYDRLRELQGGAEPTDDRCGICRDINNVVFDGADVKGYKCCEEILGGMGLDPQYPLGDDDYYKWEGDTGQRRRALAGKMADYIFNNKRKEDQ